MECRRFGSLGVRLYVLLAAVILILACGESMYRSYYGVRNDPVNYRNPANAVIDRMTGLTTAYLAFEGQHNPRGQKAAFQLLLMATAWGCAIVYLLVRSQLIDQDQLISGSLLVILLFGVAYLPSLGDTLSTYSVASRVFGLLLAVAVVVWRRFLSSPFVQKIAWAACVAFPFYWIGVGLLGPIDLTGFDATGIEELEAHWSLILGSADALATRSVDEMLLGYGNWSTLTTVAISRVTRPFSIGDYLRWIGLMQMAYFAIFLVTWSRYSRGRWVVCGIALVFSAWCFHFSRYPSLFYLTPNHSAWRYFFFSVAALTQVVCLRASDSTSAFFIGLISGMSVLHNFETGVAIVVGNLVYLVLRATSQFAASGFSATRLMARFLVAGGVVSVLVFILFHRIVIGTFPNFVTMLKPILIVGAANRSGLGSGHFLEFDPLILVIFGHCLLVFLDLATRLNSLSPRDAVRGGVAAEILVWFAYFANRPHTEYLMVYCALYGILLIDAWRVLTSSFWAERWLQKTSAPFQIAFIALGLIVLPSIYERGRMLELRRGFTFGSTQYHSEKPLSVDGVLLTGTSHNRQMIQRAEYLRQNADQDHSLYLTMDSFLMPRLAGYWPRTGVYDTFMGTATKANFDKVISQFSNPAITIVYLDEDSLARKLRGAQDMQRLSWEEASRWLFHRFRESLAEEFDLQSREAGWEVWQRRSKSNADVEPISQQNEPH